MNKEAKIGLTIILTLVIVFVAVLAKRFYSSYSADQSVAAEDKGEQKSERSTGMEKEASLQVNKLRPAVAAGQPTVVAATNLSDNPPQGTENNVDNLSTVSDSGKVEISAQKASNVKASRSFMPEPPKADVNDRYERYKTADTTTPVQTGQQENNTGNSDAGADNYRRSTSDRNVSAALNGGDQTDYRNSLRHDNISHSTKASRTYTVAEGDSLFDIARCELGKASRWAEIYNLNIDVLGKDIECLVPGTQIVLPEENIQNTDPLTRRLKMEYRK